MTQEFKVYSFETRTGVDYRIGQRRAGSMQIGVIKAETKAEAIARLKNRIALMVGEITIGY